MYNPDQPRDDIGRWTDMDAIIQKTVAPHVQDSIKKKMYEEKSLKPGDKIPVLESAHYSGQEMDWTEPFTGSIILDKNTKFLHTSETQLESFAPKLTAFSTEDILDSLVSMSTEEARSKIGSGTVMRIKYSYTLELPKGTEVNMFGNDEIRVNLEEGMNLKYIGYYEILTLDKPIEVIPKSPKHESVIRVASKYYLKNI